MTIAIVDTTIFYEIVAVDGTTESYQRVLIELETKIRADEVLLLPLATVLETGNHVARRGPSGDRRRQAAIRFAQEVRKAVDGKSPFTPTPFWEPAAILSWLDEFPDAAMRSISFGDLSIVQEWKRQSALFLGRRVYVWSLDTHLTSYDHHPTAP